MLTKDVRPMSFIVSTNTSLMLPLYLRSASPRSWPHTNLRIPAASFSDTILTHAGRFFLAATPGPPRVMGSDVRYTTPLQCSKQLREPQKSFGPVLCFVSFISKFYFYISFGLLKKKFSLFAVSSWSAFARFSLVIVSKMFSFI